MVRAERPRHARTPAGKHTPGPDAPAPVSLPARRNLRRSARSAAAAAALLVLLGAGTWMLGHRTGGPTRAADPARTWSVLAPEDGRLHLAGTVIDQLRGYCDNSSPGTDTASACHYDQPTSVPSVNLRVGAPARMGAGSSTMFWVSMFGTGGSSGQAVYEDGMLTVTSITRPGDYRLTVTGSQGGAWLVLAHVTPSS